MGELLYLIRYGVMGHVGRFRALPESGASAGRGEIVVIQSDRGIELGEILIGLDETGAAGKNSHYHGPAPMRPVRFPRLIDRASCAEPGQRTSREPSTPKRRERLASTSASMSCASRIGPVSSLTLSRFWTTVQPSFCISVPASATWLRYERSSGWRASLTWCSSKSVPAWTTTCRTTWLRKTTQAAAADLATAVPEEGAVERRPPA